jgi:parvulin-like peptidyl-prolyl isomerase
MKRSRLSSRLAAALSCTALLGAVNVLQAADTTSSEAGATTVIPPAPAASATPAAQPLELPETVAEVNGEKISRDELQKAFDNAVKASGMDASKLSDDQKLAGYHRFLDDLVIERLLKAKAAGLAATDKEVDEQIAQIKKNFPDDKAFQEQLKMAGLDEAKLREQIKNGLAQTKWIKSQIAGKTDVKPADIDAYYKENSERFKVPEDQVRASHILFSTKNAEGEDLPAAEIKKKEEAANAAYEKAAQTGTDFAALANELSEDPGNKPPGSTGRGGDLYYFGKGQMVPEFEKTAFELKVGEVSKPVKSQFGYHVIKVTGKLPKDGMIPLDDELKEQLTASLKGQKEQTAVQEVIQKLREDAKITNNLPELKLPPAPSEAAVAPGAGGTPAPDAEKAE